jgi:hypothetical protein
MSVDRREELQEYLKSPEGKEILQKQTPSIIITCLHSIGLMAIGWAGTFSIVLIWPGIKWLWRGLTFYPMRTSGISASQAANLEVVVGYPIMVGPSIYSSEKKCPALLLSEMKAEWKPEAAEFAKYCYSLYAGRNAGQRDHSLAQLLKDDAIQTNRRRAVPGESVAGREFSLLDVWIDPDLIHPVSGYAMLAVTPGETGVAFQIPVFAVSPPDKEAHTSNEPRTFDDSSDDDTADQKSESIIEYMEQRFGPVDENSMQELLPLMDDISVAINIIPPNPIHPYLVIFTNGMSDLPMTVPVGKEEWQYAELVMHLPPDWVHPRDANGDVNWMWPMMWLRKMAYYPHLEESWLGLPAAIVSSDDPPVALGPNTEQTCLLMIPDFANLNPPLHRPDGTEIHFFTVVPLYTEERDYELKHGMVEFFRKFRERKVPMTVALDRQRFS